MNALTLLDSRSFRNKLDYFVSVAARKRPAPTDSELAEAFQPVLDAAGLQAAPVVVAAPVPVDAPINENERAKPQKVRSMTDVLDDLIAEYTPRVAATPMGPNGIRYLGVPMDIPIAELTGYTNDRADAAFFVDPSEMTTVNVDSGQLMLPCRMR